VPGAIELSRLAKVCRRPALITIRSVTRDSFRRSSGVVAQAEAGHVWYHASRMPQGLAPMGGLFVGLRGRWWQSLNGVIHRSRFRP